MSKGMAVFAYGSLVAPESAALTLGRNAREAWSAEEAIPATLAGWRRRFSLARANQTCEKTFARDADGSVPKHVLALNVEQTGRADDTVNGLLIAISAAEFARLDARELRYDRVDVSDAIAPAEAQERFASVVTYVSKSAHLALEAPPDAVILRSYAAAVEEAFGRLGPRQREEYLRTTGPYPAELIDAHLVRDRIPEGNPRGW